MPFTDITLKNDANTNVVFTAFSQGEDKNEWVYRNGNPPQGWTRLKLTRKRPASGGKVTRIGYEISIPVLDSLTGAVLYTYRIVGEMFEPVVAPEAVGNDAHAYHKSLLADALMKTAANSGIIPF